MKFGSVFSGIEGFGVGFERAGMECAFQIEVDDNCQIVLNARYPNVPKYRDVSEVVGADLPRVDLLCGGFPCQDVSVAGKRSGLAGARSGLFFEFMRLVDELDPSWVVIENVPGLLSSNSGRDMGTVLGALAKRGYGYAYRVLDAQYLGVPQRRRRIFIVGHSREWGHPAEVLLEPDSVCGDSPPSVASGAATSGSVGEGVEGGGESGVAATLGAGAHGPRYDLDNDTYVVGEYDGGGLVADGEVVTSLSASLGGAGADAAHAQAGWLIPGVEVEVAKTLESHHSRCDLETETFIPVATFVKKHRAASEDDWERWAEEEVANTLNTFDLGEVRATTLVAVNLYPGQGDSTQLGATETDVSAALTSGRLGRDDRGTRVVTEIGVRRLMPLECERLQGFDDGWTDVGGMADSNRYRMLGNAVCVNAGEWLGRRIMEVSGT